MTVKGQGDGGAGNTPAITGRIMIQFPGSGDTPRITIDPDVTLTQLYAAALVLDCQAREARTGQLLQEARGHGGLALPGGDAIADMIRNLGGNGGGH